jgi:hypothetical protein
MNEKDNQYQQVTQTFSIPKGEGDSLKYDLKIIAGSENRSVSNLIYVILKNYVEEYRFRSKTSGAGINN